MTVMWQRAEDILRARTWISSDRRLSWQLLTITVIMFVFGCLYGMVMGAYCGSGSIRGLQMLYSAIKVPLLLTATFMVSLPSFFVINSLLGVRDDFKQVLRALVATQAGLSIVLASFAPLTAMWYISFEDYNASKMFNLLMFGLASILAQMLLRKYYQPLIDRHRIHQKLMRVWLVIYGFVGIQMGWILRPFIGHLDTPTSFFREDAWGNAYVTVAMTLSRLLGIAE